MFAKMPTFIFHVDGLLAWRTATERRPTYSCSHRAFTYGPRQNATRNIPVLAARYAVVENVWRTLTPAVRNPLWVYGYGVVLAASALLSWKI